MVWFDKIKKEIGNIRLPQLTQEAYAGIGVVNKTVKDEFVEAKDLIQRVKNTKLDDLDIRGVGGVSKTGKYGEDLTKLGTGSVGDFTNLKGTSIDDILSRIPKDATRRELTPVEGKVTEGFEYKWTEDGKTMRVRIHGPDASAPVGSNALNNWVVRVQQGKKYLDPGTGKFQPPGITNISSPYYNEELANRTHIPIKHPK